MNYLEHFKANFSLGMPVMLSQLGIILMTVTDTIMVGRLGSIALGGAALAGSIFFVLLVFSFGASSTLAAVVSSKRAEGKMEDLKSYWMHALVLNACMGFFLCVILYSLLPFIYHLKQPYEVASLAASFLKIIAPSFIFSSIFYAFEHFAEGLFDTRASMISVWFAVGVNIGLNYMFIFGNKFVDPMGVDGAALGTLCARFFALVIIVIYFAYRSYFKKYWRLKYLLNLKVKRFLKLIKIGFPSGMQKSLELSAFTLAAFISGSFSTNDLAAHHIALNMASITFLLCISLEVVTTIRIADKFGLKDYRAVRQLGWVNLSQVSIFMFFCGLIFILGRHFFPTLYIEDMEVIKITSSLLIIVALFQLSDGIQIVALGALRGLQDTVVPGFMAVISYWLIALPISYFFALKLGMGAFGVWIGLGVGLTFSAIMITLRYHYRTNQLIKYK